MEWWIWLALGLVLMVIELATPSGFFVMFFGLGAVTVGILVRAGAAGPAWSQWLIFTVMSVVYLLLFRDRLQQRVQQPDGKVDTHIGDLAVPTERIAPGGVGRAESRGTQWTARNVAAVAVEPGQRCRITRVDGLTLFIQPE